MGFFMKRQSAQQSRPPCHPQSEYRPILFTKDKITFANNAVQVCKACMDKIYGRGSETINVEA